MQSTPGPERWVICPVCSKPNPAGTRFCEYCWGAAISQDNPLTSEELERVLQRLENRSKFRRKIKFGIAGIGALAVVGIILYSLFWFSDTIFKPPEEMNSNPLPGDWSMFRRDLSRGGSIGTEVPQGTLKWVFDTGGAIHSSPAVVDGTVYFGSRDYNLYAVDADTGSEQWIYKTGSWVESSPSVAQGKVFFGSNDGNFYTLDMNSGEELWRFETPFPVRSSPAIADDRVYFGSDDYYLYCLDTSSGEVNWSFDSGSPAYSSPAVSNGIVFIGSGNGYSYALNSMTGQRRLRFVTHYAVYSSPAVSDGNVYFTTTNGLISAVDGKARTMWREHEIKHWWVQVWAAGVPLVPEPPPQSGFLWSLSLHRPQTSTPVVSDEVMYLGSDNFIMAIDIETQEIKWEFETGGTVRSSPALLDSVLIVGSEDGKLYAIDIETGEKLWDYQTGGKISSSPALVDGVVYVGSFDGKLYAIE